MFLLLLLHRADQLPQDGSDGPNAANAGVGRVVVDVGIGFGGRRRDSGGGGEGAAFKVWR
jgi:hypothetical protein